VVVIMIVAVAVTVVIMRCAGPVHVGSSRLPMLQPPGLRLAAPTLPASIAKAHVSILLANI
jgi:hypothetical protein